MNSTLVSNIIIHFIPKFQDEPVMIFSPGRINIIGEHTDYNDGFVFPAAVDKGIVAAIGKSNSGISTVDSIDKQETIAFSVNNLKPYPLENRQNYIFCV